MLKKKFHNFKKLTDAINLEFNYFNIYNIEKYELDFFFRQKIFDDIGLINLSNKLCSSKKIILSAPEIFLINLKKKGYDVNFFFSKILFSLNILKKIIIFIVKYILILITSIIFKSNYKNNSILFWSVSNDGLPDFNKKKIKNNCFINWYLSKYKTNNKYVYIYTSASKKNYKNYFFIKNFRPSLNFNEFKIFNSEIFNFLSQIFKNYKKIKIESLIFFDEYIDYILINSCDRKNLPKKLIFNNVSTLKRPIWTESFLKKKLPVEFVWYSTNNGIHQINEKKSFWQGLINWPFYIIWDKYHLEILKKNDHQKYKYKFAGSINYKDISKNFNLDKKSKKIISIFDFFAFDDKDPRKELETLYYPYDYYNNKLINEFYKGIINLSKLKDTIFVIKNKRSRDLNKYFFSKKFKILYDNKKKFIFADASLDPAKIIKKSDYCISLPFTSTAIVAKNLNVPSIYYDPIKKVNNNKYWTHDVPLISSLDKIKKDIEKL